MKKRLRKKHRIGEFREDCFELTFEINQSLDGNRVDEVFDEFIEMIETNNLQFGGGEVNGNWTGIVQGPYRGSATEHDRQTVLTWLHSHPHIMSAAAGPLQDAWHGWN